VFTTCTVLASRWYQFLDRIVHGITPYISPYNFTRKSYATFCAVLFRRTDILLKYIMYYHRLPEGRTEIVLLLL